MAISCHFSVIWGTQIAIFLINNLMLSKNVLCSVIFLTWLVNMYNCGRNNWTLLVRLSMETKNRQQLDDSFLGALLKTFAFKMNTVPILYIDISTLDWLYHHFPLAGQVIYSRPSREHTQPLYADRIWLIKAIPTNTASQSPKIKSLSQTYRDMFNCIDIQ